MRITRRLLALMLAAMLFLCGAARAEELSAGACIPWMENVDPAPELPEALEEPASEPPEAQDGQEPELAQIAAAEAMEPVPEPLGAQDEQEPELPEALEEPASEPPEAQDEQELELPQIAAAEAMEPISEQMEETGEPVPARSSEAFDQSVPLGTGALAVRAVAGVYQAGSALSAAEVEDDAFAEAAEALLEVGAEVLHAILDIRVKDASGNDSLPDTSVGMPVARLTTLPVSTFERENPGAEIAARAVLRDASSGAVYPVRTWLEGEAVCFELPDCTRVDVMLVALRDDAPETGSEDPDGVPGQPPADAAEAPISGEVGIPEATDDDPVDGQTPTKAAEEPVEEQSLAEATETPVSAEEEIPEATDDDPVDGQTPTEAAEEPVDEQPPTEAAEEPVDEQPPTEVAEAPVDEQPPTEEVEAPITTEAENPETTESVPAGEQPLPVEAEAPANEQSPTEAQEASVAVESEPFIAVETEPSATVEAEAPAAVEAESPAVADDSLTDDSKAPEATEGSLAVDSQNPEAGDALLTGDPEISEAPGIPLSIEPEVPLPIEPEIPLPVPEVLDGEMTLPEASPDVPLSEAFAEGAEAGYAVPDPRPDNDALFDAYLRRRLPGMLSGTALRRARAAANAAGDRLRSDPSLAGTPTAGLPPPCSKSARKRWGWRMSSGTRRRWAWTS